MGWTEKLGETKAQLRALNKAIPEAARAFGDLGKAVKADGALDLKSKECVALGIAVAIRCEPCIMFHTQALINAGATREEVAEVLSMCLQMGGGPALMYSAKALECFDQLSGGR